MSLRDLNRLCFGERQTASSASRLCLKLSPLSEDMKPNQGNSFTSINPTSYAFEQVLLCARVRVVPLLCAQGVCLAYCQGISVTCMQLHVEPQLTAVCTAVTLPASAHSALNRAGVIMVDRATETLPLMARAYGHQ